MIECEQAISGMRSLRAQVWVRQRLFLVVLGVLLTAVAVAVALDVALGEPLRRALPREATEVHERGGMGILQGRYLLRARMSKRAFTAYVRRLGLTPYGASMRMTPSWRWIEPGEPEPWWSPSDSNAGTYAKESDRSVVHAKWEDGHLYLVAGAN